MKGVEVNQLSGFWVVDYSLSAQAIKVVAEAAIGVPMCHYHKAMEKGAVYSVGVCLPESGNDIEELGGYEWFEDNHMVTTEYKNNGYFRNKDKGLLCAPANRLYVLDVISEPENDDGVQR